LQDWPLLHWLIRAGKTETGTEIATGMSIPNINTTIMIIVTIG